MALVISLGSVNADVVVDAPSNPSGPGIVLASNLVRRSGGKAANVAVLAPGLTWALFEGRSTLDATVLAVAAATVAVTGRGSQESYPDREALLAMAARVTVRDLA